LLPKIVVKMSRQGSFFVDKIILDKKGCQVVSDTPAQECIADTYYVCSAYVLSRIGDPHLVRVYTHLQNGTAQAKTFEIQSSSVIGMQMSELQPVLEGSEVDARLKENFKNCFAPQKYILDGLFTLKDAALNDNGKRRLKDVGDKLLASGAMPLVHIYGYADDSGSKPLNSELSLKRAQAVRDYLIEQGYRDGQILVSAEGSDKPLIKCKSTPATEKYDCGRLNRRVEITATLQ
jgi:outer membrane protein OmpA-like peptidoglycan-associated protein